MSTYSALDIVVLAPDTEFRNTRLRAGYAIDEVDQFVEVVEEALRSESPRLDAAEVAEQQFSQVKFKPGYRTEDVDSYLGQAERWLYQREREG
jgi:DivIVA domain-containing protein